MKQSKLNISRIFTRFTANRKHKDRLFQRVFEDKNDLLDLYNAVNNTAYTNPDELEITTLEDVIYISMKNDMSFIISSTLNLYEHQSTFNPNMPIRGFMYFARLYEAYIKKHQLDIYGRTLVKLPMPQFIIFYNGRESQPDELILKLSDAFIPEIEDNEPVLECRAKMLNINYGHNKALLDSCKRLHDYSYFVATVNTYLDKGDEPTKAIDNAVNQCIDENILVDILIKCRSEVADLLLTEFDEKLYKKTIYNEGYEDGRLEGELVGIQKGRLEGELAGIQKGRLESRDENIAKTIEILKNLKLSDAEITKIISEKYKLPEETILGLIELLPKET